MSTGAMSTGVDHPAGYLITPFTVVIDSREQLPFLFADLYADAKDGHRHLAIPMIRKGLDAGDYSLETMEAIMAIERKSLCDLFSTLGQGRHRFQRELVRLAQMQFAAVVVEADWAQIASAPPAHSLLDPKTIFRSVIAWQQRFPTIHWWMCPNRAFAERATFRILERFWRDRQQGLPTAIPGKLRAIKTG